MPLTQFLHLNSCNVQAGELTGSGRAVELLRRCYSIFLCFQSHLQPMDLITILPVVTKDLSVYPRFTPYDFLSRCKFSNLTTRQPMIEFYLLTFPRFPLWKKEHKSYFCKNRTYDFRTSRCAGYLLDHSDDVMCKNCEGIQPGIWPQRRLQPQATGRVLVHSYIHCVIV